MNLKNSMMLDSEVEIEAKRTLLQRLYEESTGLGLVGLGAAFVVAYIFKEVIPFKLLVLFLMLYIFTTLMRFVTRKRFYSKTFEDIDINLWSRVAILGAMSSGLIWGALGWYYTPEWPVSLILSMIMIYTGLIAGVHTSYAIFPSVFAAFLFSAITPLFVNILSNGEYILALLFIIYATVMFLSSFHIQSFMKENVLTAIINKRVIDENIFLTDSLKKQNDVKEKVLMGAELGYWDWYPQSHKHFVSQRWLNMLGLNRDDITNMEKDFLERIHPQDKFAVLLQIEDAIEKQNSYIVHLRMRKKTGDYIWIEGSGACVEWDSEGQPLRLSGTHRDISEEKGIQQAYEKQRIRMNALFDLNPNITIITNKNGLLEGNHAFLEFFSEYANISEFRSQHNCICEFFELVNDATYLHPSKGNWIEMALNDKNAQVNITKNAKIYNFQVVARKMVFTEGDEYIVTFNDTTERYKLQIELQENALHDPMTKLYNRRYHNHAFTSMHATASRLKGRLGFMMIDIDNFKKYNDNYGHDKGDDTLIQTANIIQSCFSRSSDVVSRLGGEEFGVIVADMSEQDIMDQANLVCYKVLNADIPHLYNDNLSVITISIGVGSCDFGTTYKSTDQLYKEADLALYESKHLGRNRVTLFRTNIQEDERD